MSTAIHAADVSVPDAIVRYLRQFGAAGVKELAWLFTESSRPDDLAPILTALVQAGRIRQERPRWRPIRYSAI